MNLYPAITYRMGTWTYYVVNMTMQELADNVKRATEVYDDRTLDEAIQRILNETRVKKDIVTYLTRQPDRFFSSVVVAALEGDPKFYPVQIADDERFAIFRDDKRLNETFGVLAFDGSQKYYALDGQHRLAAIQALLNKDDPLSDQCPPGFSDDQISVVVVVPKVNESKQTFLQRYRRLFSNLNRYAKATDQTTNIIMDEDDAVAIVTRRLIMEHEFFVSPGAHKESRRIKTSGGKNIRESDPYFTSLETFYDMNEDLLNSRERQNAGWGSEAPGVDLRTFKRFRPDEEYLDRLYNEVTVYWDGLLQTLPILRSDPPEMRVHSVDIEDETPDRADTLLFWPIGQELLAELARDLLDRNLPGGIDGVPSQAQVEEALAPLAKVEWRLHHLPWRYFLLTQEPDSGRWRMRNEDRTEALRIAMRLLRWFVGLDELDQDGVDELRIRWDNRLLAPLDTEQRQELWKGVEEVAAAARS